MNDKIISVGQAVDLLKDGMTMSTEGFTTTLFPEFIGEAVAASFEATGHPRGIEIFASGGKGDGGKTDLGLNKFAKDGLVRKITISHMGTNRKIEDLAYENKIEAYCLPQGVICQLFRAKASGHPGILTKVGIGTFIDPRVSDESKVNRIATDSIVEVVNLQGEDYLFYKTHHIDVAYLKGSIADEDGNVSIEREPLDLDVFHIAMATKASGGKVVFQVDTIVKRGTLRARQIKVPKIFVDYVVVAPCEKHRMSKITYYNPSYTGDINVVAQKKTSSEAVLQDFDRMIIQRRAALELAKVNGIVNFGIGLPDGVDSAANEMGLKMGEYVTTIESGVIGGLPNAGDEFGTAISPTAIINAVDMFGLYDGIGIDLAVLGMGESDANGNVNVTKFGVRVPGPGGFINISSGAKKIVFLGTFNTKGLVVAVENGKLCIKQEGSIKKLVAKVQQVSFSGRHASLKGKEVLYITERAVFVLRDDKLVLSEIAPGVDVQRDIIGQMDFIPEIDPRLKQMDARIFSFQRRQ